MDDFERIVTIILITFCLFCVALTFSVGISVDDNTAMASSFRFEGIGSSGFQGKIIVDTDTGVMYWVSNGTYTKGVLTPLLNADGTPRLYQK